MALKVVIAPDPVLRTVCPAIDPKDPRIKRLAREMGKTMYRNNGVGLAAPQVGETLRMFVIDVDQDDEGHRNLQVVVNPVIEWQSEETVTQSEGCLSIPGCSFQVTRPASVTMRCTDENGHEVVYEGATGLLAECLQHEYDHLEGKTIFEVLDPIARIDALQTYKEALERGAKPGDIE